MFGAPSMHDLSYLPPDTDEPTRERVRGEGAVVAALRRRGHDLGFLVRRGEPEQPEDLSGLWASDRPIHLPGVLAGGLEVFADEIQASARLFDRLRKGRRFLEELEPLLEDVEGIVPAGSTFDRQDEREIEKVWMKVVDPDPEAGGEVFADELWAKLSWVSDDESDLSMRIAFSFGVEQMLDWLDDDSRAPFTDAICEAVFPECATITGHVPLIEALEELVGHPLRFSERIVYSNAPGGGAVFHHDVEPGQRGVVFGQFHGRSAWFALPKRELAHLLMDYADGIDDEAHALRILDDEDDRTRYEVLNEDPQFARLLVEGGHAFLVEPGDALLLPNHGPHDTCWHSVFAVGRAGVAHSYGMFAI